jgi:hypothetical protein
VCISAFNSITAFVSKYIIEFLTHGLDKVFEISGGLGSTGLV